MARTKYSLGVGKGPKSLILTLTANNLEAFIAGTLQAQMPERGKVVGIYLNVGRRGGTHSTSTLDVLAGATSLLGALFDVAGLTPGTAVAKEGANLAAAAAAVAADTVLNFTTAVSGGSSPTWGAATIQVDYVPLGG